MDEALLKKRRNTGVSIQRQQMYVGLNAVAKLGQLWIGTILKYKGMQQRICVEYIIDGLKSDKLRFDSKGRILTNKGRSGMFPKKRIGGRKERSLLFDLERDEFGEYL